MKSITAIVQTEREWFFFYQDVINRRIFEFRKHNYNFFG